MESALPVVIDPGGIIGIVLSSDIRFLHIFVRHDRLDTKGVRPPNRKISGFAWS